MTIGQRAVKLIRQRAKEQGTSLKKQLDRIQCERYNFNNWETKGVNPTAFFLQQMYLDGYDVIWILTGEQTVHCKDCVSKGSCMLDGRVYCKRKGLFMRQNDSCPDGRNE